MSEEAASSSSSVSWTGGDGAGTSQNGIHWPTKVKPGKKIKLKPLQEVLNKILPLLIRRDVYQFFTQPVPAAEVPDYYTIIQRPMDFSTMQVKLDKGEYRSLDNFKTDFLLITENAQYFNSVDGPSGIIHTEAKKLQDWGGRLIEREGAAVIDEASEEMNRKSAALSNKFNIRLKKFSSPHSSALASPKVSTPSRLNQEIKMEEDDENEEENEEQAERYYADSPDEDDADSVMGTSSGRGGSVSIEGFGTPGARDSPDSARKLTKRAIRAPYTHKKNRPRISAVLGLLSTSTNDEDSEGRPNLAPISSTSGAVASAIPLLFGSDGSIDLPRLTEDERRAILRAGNLDSWPDLMTPYIESILPLVTESLSNVQNLARPLKATVDGFGSVIRSSPAPNSTTFTYDLDNLSADQQLPPFAVSSGHEFESQGSISSIPLAWPRMTPTSGSNSATPTSAKDYTNPPIRPLKGRDRDKEREAAGASNLDDWTFSRPRLAKLVEPLDLGLYPGLLPAAWINHIHSTKGGPARSRLPPFHLTSGVTFENAIYDELTSLPTRVLLDGKPGAVDSTAAVSDPPFDVTTALTRGVQQDWQVSDEEKKKAGVRGSDLVREVVFGGAVGEAYSNSIFNFIQGAAQSVQNRSDSLIDVEEEMVDRDETAIVKQPLVQDVSSRIAPSYFDDLGEMLGKEDYIGMGLIPLDVRIEAGLSDGAERSRSIQSLALDPATNRKRVIQDPSISLSKRPRIANSVEEQVKLEPEEDAEGGEKAASPQSHLKDITSAYLSGAILSTSLCEYVRNEIISPLTGGLLDVLVTAGEELDNRAAEHSDGDGDAMTLDLLPNKLMRKDTTKASREVIRHLTKKMLTGEYKKSKWQITEMTRAKEGAIELDSLIRYKEEMISEVTQQMDKTRPLRWNSTDMDTSKISTALEQYAQLLTQLSKMKEEGKAMIPLSGEILNQLRLAYIALAKLVPTKHLSKGQWAAWATYLQQQMTAHQEQQKIAAKE